MISQDEAVDPLEEDEEVEDKVVEGAGEVEQDVVDEEAEDQQR